MKKIVAIAFFLSVVPLWSETGLEIIKKVDNNQKFSTEKFQMRMIIEKGNRKMVKSLFGYGKDMGNNSFMEFTNPEDKGVKYLKLNDELWIYFPDADEIMKISGHMLRQGMMGSDISYEDMMRKETLEESYEVKLTGTQTINKLECFVVELNAKTADALYEKQIIYVDKNKYVLVKIDMHARGGRLLKTLEQFDFKKIDNRYIPQYIIMKDLRRKDSKTTIEFISVQFDIKIPPGVFSKSYLKR